MVNDPSDVSLREFLEARFDALEKQLSERASNVDNVVNDHEKRIRTLERAGTWTRIIEAVGLPISTALGVIFGIKQK